MMLEGIANLTGETSLERDIVFREVMHIVDSIIVHHAPRMDRLATGGNAESVIDWSTLSVIFKTVYVTL